MENFHDRIVIDPLIMLGKPTIKNTRITVELILKTLSEGASFLDIIDMYPHLEKEDIRAALSYASSLVTHEEIISL
jgi:uncharacterized protein (DUF433 family)